MSARRILLLCNYYDESALTIKQHIESFSKYSKHTVYTLNIFGDIPKSLNLESFDCVVIHYSLCIAYDSYLSFRTKTLIRSFSGLKYLFIQDDYRWVYKTISACRFMGIDTIFGLSDEKISARLYPEDLLPGVRVETVLTGYISQDLIDIKPIPYQKRTYDVSYRARKLSAWYGSHALQKWTIATDFIKQIESKKIPLKHDISIKEEDRLYGDAWIDLLRDSRAVLGTESGVSVLDFTDEIRTQTEAYEAANPNASFEDIRDLFFKDEDNKSIFNVISPRVFEAICSRVLLVMYEGYYSGVLKAGVHYVALKRDFSNLDEVVSIIKDEKKARAYIEKAYKDIALNPAYRFKAMVERLDSILDEQIKQRYPKIRIRNPLDEMALKSIFESLDSLQRYPDLLHLQDIEFSSETFNKLLRIIRSKPAITNSLAFKILVRIYKARRSIHEKPKAFIFRVGRFTKRVLSKIKTVWTELRSRFSALFKFWINRLTKQVFSKIKIVKAELKSRFAALFKTIKTSTKNVLKTALTNTKHIFKTIYTLSKELCLRLSEALISITIIKPLVLFAKGLISTARYTALSIRFALVILALAIRFSLGMLTLGFFVIRKTSYDLWLYFQGNVKERSVFKAVRNLVQKNKIGFHISSVEGNVTKLTFFIPGESIQIDKKIAFSHSDQPLKILTEKSFLLNYFEFGASDPIKHLDESVIYSPYYSRKLIRKLKQLSKASWKET